MGLNQAFYVSCDSLAVEKRPDATSVNGLALSDVSSIYIPSAAHLYLLKIFVQIHISDEK